MERTGFIVKRKRQDTGERVCARERERERERERVAMSVQEEE